MDVTLVIVMAYLTYGAFTMNKVDKRDTKSDDSFTRLVAPVLVAFSLPTIVAFAPIKYPGEPRHGITLSCLIAATGLFIAGMVLSIGPINTYYGKHDFIRSLRAGLTLGGICLVTGALCVLCDSMFHKWWGALALIVLISGCVVPVVASVIIWASKHFGGNSTADT